MVPPPPTYANGALLAGRYEIVRRIGQGGMGVVYEAIDHARSTRVALKSISHPDPTAIYRFKREFRALADIVHPNLVALYELVSDGAQWFFTMQLVDGVDLARALQPEERSCGATDASERAAHERTTRRLSGTKRDLSANSLTNASSPRAVDWRKVRRVFAQVAAAVHALHTHRRLHRDLKPSNVLVRKDGTVVVLDFGLVAELDGGGSDTERPADDDASGAVRVDRAAFALSNAPLHAQLSDDIVTGTIPYMAPEQASCDVLTTSCDWYAVGVMLYQVATGRLPFEGAPARVLALKLTNTPVAPRELNPSMPEDLDALCMALLRTRASDRPDARAVLDALRTSTSGERPAIALERQSAQTFVGRERELAELRALFARSVAGEQTIAFVRGANGDGKTALVQRFCGSIASQAIVLEGRCFEHERVPFETIDGVIDALVKRLLAMDSGELDRVVPADIGALEAVFPVLSRSTHVRRRASEPVPWASSDTRAARATRALGALLSAMSATAPVVIVIDDAHWGDVDGARMAADLLSIAGLRLMLVVIHRDDLRSAAIGELRGAGGSLARLELPVGPLPLDEARALVRARAAACRPDPSTDALWVERVVDWSGGSPWLIELLVDASASLGVIARRQGLDALIRARAESLSEASRSLLSVLCAAGAPIAIRTAYAAAGGGQPADLHALCRAFLARTTGPSDDDRVEPFHDRVRGAWLRTMSSDERASAHQRLARAMGDHRRERRALLAWIAALVRRGELARGYELLRSRVTLPLRWTQRDTARALAGLLRAPSGERAFERAALVAFARDAIERDRWLAVGLAAMASNTRTTRGASEFIASRALLLSALATASMHPRFVRWCDERLRQDAGDSL